MLYAHVTNTEGCAYYDMNYLAPSRAAFEICLDIRQKHLKGVHPEIANVLGNLGNVESSEGNYTAALDYLEKAAQMRSELGNDEVVYLALTFMQIGRTYALQDRDQEAYQMLQKSESLLNRKGARNKLFIGHVHYAFGNLELKRGDLEQATASFEKCRYFARAQGPLLPLTASANYKLGVVEAASNHHKKAVNLLNKALEIAETRNPGELDGGVVRVQWRIAEVLLDDPLGDRREEALTLKREAEYRRQELVDKLGINLRGLDHSQDEEKSFDLLVPGYFR
jgi:tetratricopeptide (TPR) repeat protein